MSRLVRRRRLLVQSLVAMAVLLLGMVSMALLHRPATGRVALVGTLSDRGSARVTGVELSGSGGSVTLTPPDTPLAAAPNPTDLGVHAVRAERYERVTLRMGGRTLSAHVALHVVAGTLTPLLLAVRGTALTGYVGNDQVNQGLLEAGGRFTAVPDVAFTDQAGRSVPFSSLGGRITVVAALDSHCHESCPLYTAILADLDRTLGARGWRGRVNIAEVTMDPERDTPEELAAYARMTGLSWELLTADPGSTLRFWSALHAAYSKHPNVGAPPIDWYTGRPETYHLHHDSLAVVLDANNVPRYVLQGNPRLGHPLAQPLARLLAPDVTQTGLEAVSAWTLGDLLDRIDTLMHLPGEQARAPETAVRQGARAPDFSLAAVDGRRVALSAPAGHPVIVNFWATWCLPCRRELLGTASSTGPTWAELFGPTDGHLG